MAERIKNEWVFSSYSVEDGTARTAAKIIRDKVADGWAAKNITDFKQIGKE